MLRERLDKIRSFREDSKREQTPNDHDAVPHFIYVDQKDDKRLRSLAGVVKRQKNVFRDYNLLWKNVNRQFMLIKIINIWIIT